MRRLLLAAAIVALAILSFGSIPASAQQARVVTTCGGTSPFPSINPGASSPLYVDPNGNACVNATVTATATVNGFQPSSSGTFGTPVSAQTTVTTGSTQNLPTGAVVVATNVGSTNIAYCALGATASTTSQAIAPGGGWFAFTVGSATQITCVTSTSTTTVNTQGGAGLATGTGGGGGSGGGGLVVTDKSSFTSGASQFTPNGGFFQTTATSNPLTTGQQGTAQMTAYRAIMNDWYNSSGTEMGTSSSPVQVSLANTASNATAVLVTGTGGAFPLSQGGSALGATNGIYTNLLQGNAVISATNPLFTNLSQGSTAVSAANPIFSGLSIGGAVVSATNGEYVNLLQGNAVIASGNPIFAQLTTGSANIGAITNTGFNVLQGGSAVSTANPLVTRLVDASGNTINSTSNNLNVQCANCSGSGVSTGDNATFTAGSSLFAGTGGEYSSALPTAITTGHQAMAAITQYRSLWTDWYNSSGTEMGTTASPVQVGAPSGAFASGSFASGALAAGSISSGAAVSGAFATGAIADLALAQGSTTSGQKANLVLGAATTGAPTDTTGNSYPLSLTTAGGLRSDLSSVNATTILTGTGAQGAGSPRVTVATDTATIAGSAVGTAGTASTNVVTVQGIASGTNLAVSQATASALNATVVGAAANGAALAGNPVLIAGSDATNARSLSTDTSGHLIIEPGNTANTTPWLATARVVGNAGGIMDLTASGTTAAASALQVAGVYNSTPLVLTNGQGAAHQLDASGYLEVDVKAGSAGNAAASATGSAVPANASYTGVNVGGTLRGWTAVNPTGSVYAGQIDAASLGGTSLAAATAWGTAPSGNVLNANVNIQGCLSSICPALGQAAAAASSPVVGATGTIAGGSTGTAGSAATTVVTVQGISGGTSLNVSSTSSVTDQATFTYGTSTYSPIGGVYNTSITNLTSGQGGALALTADRNAFVNLNKVGGTAITLGQTTMSASLPVTIASNQTSLPVGLNTTPSLANGNGVVLYQGGALSATNGIYTNILQGNAALTSSNVLFTELDKVAGTALSNATSAYGTPPTGTTVMGVNAYVTNSNANVGDNADSVAPSATFGSPVVDHLAIFDGTNWDRVRGDASFNLLASPGANTGSFAAWSSSVSTTRTIVTTNGAPAAIVQFDLAACTGSPTGAVTFNISYDGGANWNAATNSQVMVAGNYTPAANPLTLNWQASANQQTTLILLHGATGLQIVLSSAISGTGTCTATPYFAMLPTIPQMGSIAAVTASVPNSLTYMGINQEGSLTGIKGCDNHVFKHITSATDTLAVQGVASQIIYICGATANAAGTATWYLENTASTNANCSSANTQITGVKTMAVNNDVGFYNPFWGGLKNTSGNGLCINSTGTGGVDVDIWYAQF